MISELVEQLSQTAVGERFGAGSLVVEYDCVDGATDFHHHQRFVGGRLVAWEHGPADRADLCLRQPRSAHLAMLSRTVLGNEVLEATEVVLPEPNDDACPPPLDEVRSDWARDLPVIATAGRLVVQQVLTDSPFGDVSTVFIIDRGQVEDARLGWAAEPDVFVQRRYSLALGERDGSVDLMESLEGGLVLGDFPKVSMFLGGYETDECIEARRALSRPHCRALAMLGEFLCSPRWNDFARTVDLEAETRPQSVP